MVKRVFQTISTTETHRQEAPKRKRRTTAEENLEETLQPQDASPTVVTEDRDPSHQNTSHTNTRASPSAGVAQGATHSFKEPLQHARAIVAPPNRWIEVYALTGAHMDVPVARTKEMPMFHVPAERTGMNVTTEKLYVFKPGDLDYSDEE